MTATPGTDDADKKPIGGYVAPHPPHNTVPRDGQGPVVAYGKAVNGGTPAELVAGVTYPYGPAEMDTYETGRR